MVAESEALLAAEPGVAFRRRVHAVNRRNLSASLRAAGRWEEARGEARGALVIYTALRAADPENRQATIDVASATSGVGLALADGGRDAAARAELLRALGRAEIARQADPEKVHPRTIAADCHEALAELAERSGDRALLVHHLDRLVELRQWHGEREPENRQATGDLAAARERRAAVAAEGG
jgi:hypothetical protein